MQTFLQTKIFLLRSGWNWITDYGFYSRISQSNCHRTLAWDFPKPTKKRTKYIKPHFTYCLHYKLALGAREDMMCGMFHFMTFQSGAFCFDAMQIFILQPTQGNPTRHSYELCCYSSRTFLKLLYIFQSRHHRYVKTISFGFQQTLDSLQVHKITSYADQPGEEAWYYL